MSRCTLELAFRELDEAFRLTDSGSIALSDVRRGKNTRRTLLTVLRDAAQARGTLYKDKQVRLRLFALAYNLGNPPKANW